MPSRLSASAITPHTLYGTSWMTLVLFVILAAFESATLYAGDGLVGKLVVTGSSTIAPLVSEIGKHFESVHPGVRVDVQTGGSSRGIADIKQGLADIGMASRRLKPGEHDLYGTVIARDGIGMVVHQDNPVTHLGDAQVVDIYRGNITNWREVGGRDAPIVVVNKASGRATLELFLHYFKLRNAEIKAHVVIGDNEQGVKMVAGNRNAIGYVSIGTAEFDITQGVPIRLLPIGGVEATLLSVGKGKFPLSRPLTLVTRTVPTGLAKAFIDFARSREVYDLVRQQYFVPVTQ